MAATALSYQDTDARQMLLPQRENQCGAIVTSDGTVYFGHDLPVSSLLGLHNEKGTRYCNHTAHYDCLGDRSCDDHLLDLIKAKLVYFADNRVAVTVLD